MVREGFIFIIIGLVQLLSVTLSRPSIAINHTHIALATTVMWLCAKT